MSTKTISPELKKALKRPCFGKRIGTLPERLVLAEQGDVPIEDVLLMLLTDEIQRRESSAADRRAAKAGLEPDIVIERWDKSAKVHLDRKLLHELSTSASSRHAGTW